MLQTLPDFNETSEHKGKTLKGSNVEKEIFLGSSKRKLQSSKHTIEDIGKKEELGSQSKRLATAIAGHNNLKESRNKVSGINNP